MVEKKRYSVVVEKANGQRFALATSDADKFSVYQEKAIGVAAGEKLLMRGKCPAARLSTGDVVEVANINSDRSLLLKTGQTIPADFRLFDHGYCLTSHTSQGKKAQVSISIMGAAALRSAKAREAYVAHSRFREKITIFTTNPEKAREVFQKAGERFLAKEIREQAESKALANARVKARQMAVQQEKEILNGTKNTRGIRAGTGVESPRANSIQTGAQQSDSDNRRSETVADGGQLRHSPGSDRENHDNVREGHRVKTLRRSDLNRQRARRSIGRAPSQGYHL